MVGFGDTVGTLFCTTPDRHGGQTVLSILEAVVVVVKVSVALNGLRYHPVISFYFISSMDLSLRYQTAHEYQLS